MKRESTRIIGKKVFGPGMKKVNLQNIPISNQERIANEIWARMSYYKDFIKSPAEPMSVYDIQKKLETFSFVIEQKNRRGFLLMRHISTLQSNKRDILNGLASLVDDGLVREISDGKRKKYLFVFK